MMATVPNWMQQASVLHFLKKIVDSRVGAGREKQNVFPPLSTRARTPPTQLSIHDISI